MGLPPFFGLLGRARRQSSWSLSMGITGVFALVGLGLFVHWGLLPFTRPAIGGTEMEPITTFNVMTAMRVIGTVALVLVPSLALMNRSLRGSFLLFLLNPFAQILFSLSFGQRDLFGLIVGHLVAVAFVMSLAISCIDALNFPADFNLQDWSTKSHRECDSDPGPFCPGRTLSLFW